jgi:hypothetical protein
MIAARGHASDFWSIAIANATLAFGYGLLWSGVRTFEGRRALPAVTLAGAIVWLTACTIDSLYASPPARATLMAIILISYLLLAIFELWRARSDEPLMSRWPIMVLLAAHAVLMPIRIPLAGLISREEGLNADLLTIVVFEALLIGICVAYLFGSVAKERIALRYKHASLSDSLTGIANRRAFQKGRRKIDPQGQVCRSPGRAPSIRSRPVQGDQRSVWP